MPSFSGLEIGLCFLFGCILLTFLLWWKKIFSRNKEDIETQHCPSSIFIPTVNLSSYTSCWKTSQTLETQEKDLHIHVKQHDSDMGLGLKDLGDESVDLEIMRLHNLNGPPRFLFTINEESKEDLESEMSKKGSRTTSFNDIPDTFATPFLPPLASPPLKILLPQQSNLEGYHHNGLNPLFDSNELAISKIQSSSPPPTFKFLRDAEEKLLKRLMQMEIEKRRSSKKMDQDSPRKTEDKDGTFVKMVVSKGSGEGGHHQVSTHSKVIPLASSPSTTMAPFDKKW